VSGGKAPSYTRALFRLKKKNKIRAAAETATRPPATPPAMAPLLEEPDEGDEVEETAGSEDEMEEEVEAASVEDGTTEDVETPLIIPPPRTSGRSEKGSVVLKTMTEKGEHSYHRQYTIDCNPSCPQSEIYGQYLATTRDV
jgi:hypothetical protein